MELDYSTRLAKPPVTIAELTLSMVEMKRLCEGDISAADHPRSLNWKRALRGAQVLCYVDRRFREPITGSLVDLLADLLHVADALTIDAEAAWKTAHEHHDAEIRGEG